MIGSPKMGAMYDIAFAGAGLAGLSLAVRLAALPHPPRMVLIDPLRHRPRDRTWCHWQLHEHPFTAAVTHSWQSWMIRTSRQMAVTRHSPHPYTRIPSDLFYEMAYEKLAASPHVDFLEGVSVATITTHADHAALQLTDGSMIRAAWAFDSRPSHAGQAPWRQIFRGLELHSSAANLDTSVVTLMDFISADKYGIRFFYVLPLDSHTALVEDTWLIPTGHTPRQDDKLIIDYARKNLAPVEWCIRHREQGDLPMGLKLPKIPTQKYPSRIFPWGIPGGAVRASSGYAFSRIQRTSERMTAAWLKNGCPDIAVLRESPVLGKMDHIFLNAMARHPHRVPEFFTRLFDRMPPDALVRFMESEPNANDLWKIMRALPAAPFLAAAIR